MIDHQDTRPPAGTAEQRIARLQEALQRRFRAAGHGSIQRVQQALDLGVGYFKDQRRPDRRRIDLRVLFRTLDQLEVDPADFFADALGSVDPLTVFLSQAAALGCKGPRPRILDLARQRRGDETDRAELSELEALGRANPKLALRRAHALIRRLEQRQVPGLLGIYASACCRLGRFDQAQVVLAEALELAAGTSEKGDLLQRASYVAAGRGDYRSAIALSEQAVLAFVAGGDLAGIGKNLIDQGSWLATLGRTRRAIRVLEGALGPYLPAASEHPEVRRDRFSCLMSLGTYHLELGELEAARRYARLAGDESGADPVLHGRLLWLQASIAGRRGRLEEAGACLRQAVEIYRPIAPIESALAAVELVRVQLLGDAPEVYDTARALTRYLEPLKDNRVASAAIADLLRPALAGRGLTTKLVDRVARGIRKGQRPRGRMRSSAASARLPGTPHPPWPPSPTLPSHPPGRGGRAAGGGRARSYR